MTYAFLKTRKTNTEKNTLTNVYQYGKETDVYALGVVIFNVWNGYLSLAQYSAMSKS